MKSPKDLEALAEDPNYEMTADEARLHDLLVYNKTGKRTDKFKDKNKKKNKKKDEPEGLILKKDLKAVKPKRNRVEPPTSTVVIQNEGPTAPSATT